MKTIRPRRWVKLFAPEFRLPIVRGEKVGTIRPKSLREPQIADVIDCRIWSGKPYRSKQVTISQDIIVGVYPVVIHVGGMIVSIPDKNLDRIMEQEKAADRRKLDLIAFGEGFQSWKEMQAWFASRYDLPFRGTWIYWGRLL